MEPEIWRKVLITDSQYPTTIMRECWALSNRPQEREVQYLKEDGRPPEMKKFYILNLVAPGEKTAPLGICESDIKWLKRGQRDIMLFQPPLVPASVWVNPHWPGL